MLTTSSVLSCGSFCAVIVHVLRQYHLKGLHAAGCVPGNLRSSVQVQPAGNATSHSWYCELLALVISCFAREVLTVHVFLTEKLRKAKAELSALSKSR